MSFKAFGDKRSEARHHIQNARFNKAISQNSGNKADKNKKVSKTPEVQEQCLEAQMYEWFHIPFTKAALL